MSAQSDPLQTGDGPELAADSDYDVLDELVHDPHGAPRPVWDEETSEHNWEDPTADEAIDHIMHGT